LIIHSTGMSHKFGPICGHVREANFREFLFQKLSDKSLDHP
jgi:hypothetical protein